MSRSCSLQFGTTQIEYELAFARRKTVGIAVHPDQRVVVTAPKGTDLAVIESLVRKHARWILKQQCRFASYASHETPRSYVSGESFRYLGRQVRLKVLEGERPGVRLERGLLYVTVVDKTDSRRVQAVLESWYRRQARRVFAWRLKLVYPRVERLGVRLPPLAIRKMKTRWGSCSPSGLVTLNLKLVQVPIPCIDHVLVHELCHLKEHNHSKRYYALLDQALPDWRERRKRLNEFEFS